MKSLNNYFYNTPIGLLYSIGKLKKTEYLDRDQIRTVQDARFRDLLRHVLETSKFYSAYYRENGVDIGDIDDIQLKDLPIINKQIMMDNYDDFVCNPMLKKDKLESFIADSANKRKKYLDTYYIIHTSGSTGNIGIFAFGPKEWTLLKALILTRISRSKINVFKKNKIAYVGATDGHYAGITMVNSVPQKFFNLRHFNINGLLKEIITEISTFQPDVLSGYSSAIYLIAQEQLKGNIQIKPKRILCTADMLTTNMRSTIKAAFNINPINYYASSESLGIAAQCELCRDFHMFTDWHCMEVVDQNNNLLGNGNPGKLLLTNLYNYTQPLIRYDMSDEVVINDEECSCDWSFPTIKSIAGRHEEFLWFEKDNQKEFVHPIVIAEFFVPGLERFQVVQIQRNKLTMKAVISKNKEDIIPAINKRMQEILAEKNLERIVSFNVEIVEKIQNNPETGKYKLIIPYN